MQLLFELSTHGLKNIQSIACITIVVLSGTVNIYDGIFFKNSNVCMFPACASAGECNAKCNKYTGAHDSI